MVLHDPQVLVDGKPSDQLGPKAQGMAEGALFGFSAGRCTHGAFPPGLSPEAANFWRTIASSLQSSGPGRQGAAWTSSEFDSTGNYEAQYSWNGETIVRSKARYTLVLQSGPQLASMQQLEPRLAKSETRIVLDNATKDSKLERLQMEESVLTELHQGVVMAVQTELRLGLVSDKDVPAVVQTQTQKLLGGQGLRSVSAEEAIALTPESDAARFDELRLKDWPFDEALDAAARANETGADKQPSSDARKREYSAFSALTAYLRSRPETLKVAERTVYHQDEKAVVMVSALGAAGTPETQQLLGRIAVDLSLRRSLRSRAVVKLAHATNPATETIEVFRNLLDDEFLWGQTVLGLGTLGRTMRDAGRTQEFDTISEMVGAELQANAKSPKLTKALSAVSNLGDARLLGLVRPFLKHEDERVRAAAVLGLRHMQTPEVDPLIAAALTQLREKDSRLQVLSAIRSRGPLPVHHRALQTLLEDPNLEGQVRSRATKLLSSWNEIQPK